MPPKKLQIDSILVS